MVPLECENHINVMLPEVKHVVCWCVHCYLFVWLLVSEIYRNWFHYERMISKLTYFVLLPWKLKVDFKNKQILERSILWSSHCHNCRYRVQVFKRQHYNVVFFKSTNLEWKRSDIQKSWFCENLLLFNIFFFFAVTEQLYQWRLMFVSNGCSFKTQMRKI